MSTDTPQRQLDELRELGLQPTDLQNDVLDSELPTLEGEVAANRNQQEAEYIDALTALRELQVGDPVRWKIWRIDNPTDKRLNGFCCECGTSDLTMDRVAGRWGGGKYRIRGNFSNGKFAGQRTIDIAGDVKPLESPAVMPQFNPGPQFDMNAFMAFQAAQDAKRQEQARQDRKDFMAMVLPIAGQLAAALIGRATPPQQDLAALITALRPAVAPPDPMDSMKKMAETMTLLNRMNGSGDSDSLASILTAAAPYAQPILGALAAGGARSNRPPILRRAGQQPPPIDVRPNPSATIPQTSAPSTAGNPLPAHTGVNLEAPSQPLTEKDRAMFAQLKPQVDALVTMAAQGSDPSQTADAFFEQVMARMDDQLYDSIADFILSPNAIQQIAVFNTGVKNHEAFFVAFQKRVSERITAEHEAAAAGIQGTGTDAG